MSLFDDKTLAASRAAAEHWYTEYQKLVRRFGEGAPEPPQTHSGLPLKGCYFPHDLAEAAPASNGSAVAEPGAYPFTRGNLPSWYQLMAWANQPVIGYGLPEQTRERMDLLTSQGMVGYFGQPFYNLVYDLVSHEGLDPDHPAARGRIGQCGMAVYSVRDMERLFHDMDLTKMNVIHITYYQVIPALAQYIAYAARRGVDKAELRGNSMNWYHQSAYVGMSAFPPEQGLKLAVALIAYCSKHMRRWNTTNFFAYGVEEAGGTAVQEMALMLAYGKELTRACIEAGLAPDAFLPRFGFQFAQASDFFEQIAKIRAFRQLWAQMMRDQFGARDPRSLHVRIHTHTSGASLTAQQPLVNLIRTTLQALGAVLSGTQAMEVSCYDEAFAIPTEEAHLLALRVQQVIKEETNVTTVSDPLAGSYFVESLTSQLGKAALEMVAAIEAQGGYVSAQRKGWIRRQVESSAAEWRRQVDSGQRRIVGLNCYQVEENARESFFQVSPEIEKSAVERIQELRAARDAARWERAMGELEAAAQEFAQADVAAAGSGRLMAAAVEAAQADATTGEMMGVLKRALGWGPPH
ncbi:MAG TPA: acyl-CoA mutase large subunit family protein [Polyangia bacterium]|nr:acyl-CoA mutase large subunit family protein [Polyangia bacterium]